MVLDKDSKWIVAAYWAVFVAVVVLLFVFKAPFWLFCVLGSFFLILATFVTFFFRVPERGGCGNNKVVTSVADGDVVIIDRVVEDEYLKHECIRVCVYMDFFDVHANFWPVTGTVCYCKYHPGKHKLAFLSKSSDLNEHETTAIRTPEGRVMVFRQVAGTFARRVVSYSRKGLFVVSGEQCGIIKFGSRIDMFFPLDAEIKVEVGDRVWACDTPIAIL